MNIELSLLAVMLKNGDFGPIQSGDIKEEHFGTDQGIQLFQFINDYRRDTGGNAIYPSLKVVRSRFSHLELPEPDPGDTVANLADEVRNIKLRSDLRSLSLEIESAANGVDSPALRVLEIAGQLRRITEAQVRTPHVSLADGIQDVVHRYENGVILPNGMDWPWPTLTKSSKGLHKGELVVIAGRPKSRKTFTALRIGTHAVKHGYKRVLVFSPEMPVQQMFLRCVAHFCDLPYSEFKDGSLEEAQRAHLYEAARVYGRLKNHSDEQYLFELGKKIPNLGDARPSLDIIHSAGKDTSWMAAQIEVYQPDIVIADSFYRQRAVSGRKNDVDYKAITALSREMKDLAGECNVAIIGTHQLNREAQRSVGDINNLAWADAIAQDADAIYRVVTGKMPDHGEVSALLNYASREVKEDGVLISNKPCYDYSEIGPILNKQQVVDLMRQEDKTSQEEENKELRKKAASGLASPKPLQRKAGTSLVAKAAASKPGVASHPRAVNITVNPHQQRRQEAFGLKKRSEAFQREVNQ
jgi:replicative DNA helicase